MTDVFDNRPPNQYAPEQAPMPKLRYPTLEHVLAAERRARRGGFFEMRCPLCAQYMYGFDQSPTAASIDDDRGMLRQGRLICIECAEIFPRGLTIAEARRVPWLFCWQSTPNRRDPYGIS